MESDSDGAALVLQQCNDIIRLQEELCNSLQEKSSCHVSPEEVQTLKDALQAEQSSHQQTRYDLEQERERARFAESELAILKRQLNREKTTFENAFGLLRSQALTDSSKTEDLLAKCSALEAVCAQKDDELVCKDRRIRELQQRLREVQEKHHQQLVEVQVQAQQDAYVARHLGRQERPQSRTKLKRHT